MLYLQLEFISSGGNLTEFVVAFELVTIVYLIILIPLLTFLIFFAYRYATYFADTRIINKLNESMELSRLLILKNNRLLRENLQLREKMNKELEDSEQND